jgi:hypothetical protein
MGRCGLHPFFSGHPTATQSLSSFSFVARLLSIFYLSLLICLINIYNYNYKLHLHFS